MSRSAGKRSIYIQLSSGEKKWLLMRLLVGAIRKVLTRKSPNEKSSTVTVIIMLGLN